MADQRAVGNADTSPAEVGAQVRDKAQEVGAQIRDKAQGVGAQVRDKAQELVRQGKETASDYYQQVDAVEHSLEDAIRAKPWQAICMAAGIGMFLTLLWKKEEPASDAYQRGRRQVEALQHTVADTMRAKPWQAYYQQGRQQVDAVEHSLEDTVRAKPLQALLLAAGVGIFLGVLLKK
jgi:ElaB/YqjD/DUF883 family membrane-anchored ribosome-binding protein